RAGAVRREAAGGAGAEGGLIQCVGQRTVGRGARQRGGEVRRTSTRPWTEVHVYTGRSLRDRVGRPSVRLRAQMVEVETGARSWEGAAHCSVLARSCYRPRATTKTDEERWRWSNRP